MLGSRTNSKPEKCLKIRTTVCVTCVWAGVDSMREQKNSKRENARKCRRIPSVQCTPEDRARSFYARERLVVYTNSASKVAFFREKDAFFAFSRGRSENALLGNPAANQNDG